MCPKKVAKSAVSRYLFSRRRNVWFDKSQRFAMLGPDKRKPDCLERLEVATKWLSLIDDSALHEHKRGPRREYDRIPDDFQGKIIDMAVEGCVLCPVGLAVTFTHD